MPNPTQAKFNPPMTNDGGATAVTAGEIVKYTLSVGLKAASGETQTYPLVLNDIDVTPAPDGTISIPLDGFSPPLAPGDYVGIVQATTGAGVENDPSAPAEFTIAAPVVKPDPCTALTFV